MIAFQFQFITHSQITFLSVNQHIHVTNEKLNVKIIFPSNGYHSLMNSSICLIFVYRIFCVFFLSSIFPLIHVDTFPKLNLKSETKSNETKN